MGKQLTPLALHFAQMPITGHPTRVLSGLPSLPAVLSHAGLASDQGRGGGPREAHHHHLTWSSPGSGFGKWAQPGKRHTSDRGRQDSGRGRARAHPPSWFPHPPLQGGSSQQDPRTQPCVHCTLLPTCTPLLHAASRMLRGSVLPRDLGDHSFFPHSVKLLVQISTACT